MSIDLSDLDIVALAETGTVTELRHPGTKKPLVDDAGKPYFIEHRGFDSAECARFGDTVSESSH